MIQRVTLLLLIVFMLFSCASKQKFVYFQGLDAVEKNQSRDGYEPKLQQDDMLLILVSAAEPKAAMPFNLLPFSVSDNTANAMGILQNQTYLINNKGYIEFPVLGSIKLAGLSSSEAVNTIKVLLLKYLKDPVVNLRILNFKFSVLGEVIRPGVYTLTTERITVPEALALSGDLSIFGNRKNILIIRDVDGFKTHNFIDITNANFINSPFYYLDQNDVIYVEPNKTKINASAVGPNISVIISAISVLITVAALLIR